MSIIATFLTWVGFKAYVLPVLQSIMASIIYDISKDAFTPQEDEIYPEIPDSLRDAFKRAFAKVNGCDDAMLQKYLEMDFRHFQRLVYEDFVHQKEMDRVTYIDKKLYEAFRDEVRKSKNVRADLTFELIQECKRQQSKSLDTIKEVKNITARTLEHTETLVSGQKEISGVVSEIRDKMVTTDSLKCMLEQLSSHNSADETKSIVMRLLPTVRNMITNLRVKTAYEIILKLEQELEIKCPNESELKAKVIYSKAMCERYMPNVSSVANYSKAHELLDGKYDEEIFGGYVSAMLADKKLDKAKSASLMIREHNEHSIWAWITEFIESYDSSNASDRIPKDLKDVTLCGYLVLYGVNVEKIKTLIPDFSYVVPQTLDYTKYNEWVLRLRFSLDNLLEHWDYSISKLSANSKKNEEIKEFYDLSDRFLSLLNQTEAINIMPDVVFLHDYCAFVNSSDVKFLNDMNNHLPTAAFREIYSLMKVNMMVSLNLGKEAFEYIDSQPDITDLIANVRLNIALEMFDVDEIVNSFRLVADKHIVMKPYRYGFFVSALKSYPDKVGELAKTINFENKHDEEVYHLLAKIYLQEEVDVSQLKLHEKDVCPMLHCIMADGYSLLGQMQDALNLMRKSVDRNVIDFRTYQYISLLKKWEQGGVELYHFLKDLREAGFVHNNQWLVDEGNLAATMSDYEGAKAPFALLHERMPDDNNLLSSYLFILDKLSEHDEIDRVTKDIISRHVEPKHVPQLFHIMKNNGLGQRAVDFLYQEIMSTNDQHLRSLWFQTSLMSNVREIITAQHESIEDGDYVLMEQDGKEVYDLILSGGRLENLIGKKIGDTLDLKMFSGIEHYEVKGIFTKYYKLLREVMDEAHKNRFKEFTSFSLDDLKAGDGDMFANLERITQSITGEEFQQYNEQKDLDEYRKGQRPLVSFISDHELVGGMYEKLFGDFRIYIPQAMPLLQAIEEAGNDTSNFTYVLDLSSLLLMEELHKLCGFTIEKKFIVSKGLVQLIKDTAKKEELGSLTYISETTYKQLHIQNPQEGETPLKGKLRTLLSWIDSYCEVVVAEALVNLSKHSMAERTLRMDIASECALLVMNQNRVLLTEDFGLFKMLAQTMPIMSCEMWLKLNASGYEDSFNELFVRNHFIGIHLTAKDIVNMYLSADNELTRDLQTTITYNPCIWTELLDAAYTIMRKEENPQSLMMCTHVLTMLFREHDDKTARNIYIVGVSKYRDDFYKKSITDALRRTHPALFVN